MAASQTQSRINYKVVYATSSDEGYSATELENQVKHTTGWQSARFCEYPQEIILQFSTCYQIAQIQILSHHSKISHRIDIFVGNNESDASYGQETLADPRQAVFKRLGYLSLDSNQRSDYKARELKSVFMDTKASFVKFVIQAPHVNQHNIFQQVGLIAIAVLGTQTPSQLDDLSFDLQVDPVSARQIREMNEAKIQAVKLEQYDEAKRLKLAIATLKEVGAEIKHLDRQKAIAVAEEDYDRAKQIKDSIDRLRARTIDNPTQFARAPPQPQYPQSSPYDQGYPPEQYQRVPPNPHYVAADSQRMPANPQYMSTDAATYAPAMSEPHRRQITPQMSAYPPPSSNMPGYEPRESPREEISAHGRQSSAPHSSRGYISRGQTPPDASQQPYFGDSRLDDRPIKSIASDVFNKAVDDGKEEVPAITENTSSNVAEPLSSADRKQAAPYIEMFGEPLIQCLYSKAWSLRLDGVQQLQQMVSSSDDSLALFSTCGKLLAKKILQDRVPQVFFEANALVENLVQTHIKNIDKDEVQRIFGQVIAAYMKKLGDSNQRIQNASQKMLIYLAQQKKISAELVVVKHLLKAASSDTNPKSVQARTETLTEFVSLFQFRPDTPFTVPQVMAVVLVALQHRTGAIRDSGIKLATEVYKCKGNTITSHLENLKPALKELLIKSFSTATGTGQLVSINTPQVAESAPPVKKTTAAKPSSTKKQPPSSQKKKTPDKKKQAPAKKNPEPKPAPSGQPPASPGPSDEFPVVVVNDEIQDDDYSQLLGFCSFCGLEDPQFFDPQKLDFHYLNDCPMLITCTLCQQVIEIPTLTEHILTECVQGKAHYSECPRCKEPVANELFAVHTSQATCKPALPPSDANRCPLCHQDIPPGDEGWSEHILDGTGCPSNERTRGQS